MRSVLVGVALGGMLVAIGCRHAAGTSAVLSSGAPASLPAAASAPTGIAAVACEERVDVLLEVLRAPPSGYVMLGAHRGDWRRAPENSLRAIRNCIDMGLDLVEVDVKRTVDGKLVLMHDDTLDRTTTGSGPVAEHTLAQIRELFLTNPHGVATRHRVPTLEEAMELCRGRILVFLDKANPYVDELADVLERTSTARQTIIFGGGSSAETRSHFGDLLGELIYIPKVKENQADLEAYLSDLEGGLAPRAYAVWYTSRESPAFRAIGELRTSGHHVWVSTLWPWMSAGADDDLSLDDPEAGWGRVVRDGATIILTDRPVAALAYLDRAGHRRLPQRQATIRGTSR